MVDNHLVVERDSCHIKEECIKSNCRAVPSTRRYHGQSKHRKIRGLVSYSGHEHIYWTSEKGNSYQHEIIYWPLSVYHFYN